MLETSHRLNFLLTVNIFLPPFVFASNSSACNDFSSIESVITCSSSYIQFFLYFSKIKKDVFGESCFSLYAAYNPAIPLPIIIKSTFVDDCIYIVKLYKNGCVLKYN